jgi:hypothetical protein
MDSANYGTSYATQPHEFKKEDNEYSSFSVENFEIAAAVQSRTITQLGLQISISPH